MRYESGSGPMSYRSLLMVIACLAIGTVNTLVVVDCVADGRLWLAILYLTLNFIGFSGGFYAGKMSK